MVTAMEKDKSVCASQMLKEVDVLQAIYWVKQPWDNVHAETIQKCFDMCGFNQASSGMYNLYSCFCTFVPLSTQAI